MTQRKCGTCRFYEAGAQQSHGQCRNPAYPQRDDTALLRPEETGCRTGWGVDFWVARDGQAVADAPLLPNLHIDQHAPLSLSPAIAPILPPLRTQVGSAAGTELRAAPQAARRPLPQVSDAPSPAKPEPTKAKEILPPLDPALLNHPEIGENGVLLPRANRRSAVADAHKRALARREEERLQALARDRATATVEMPEPIVAERERSNGGGRGYTEPSTPPIAPPAPPIAPEPPKLTADDLKKPAFELTAPAAPTFKFGITPPRESVPPREVSSPRNDLPSPAPMPEPAPAPAPRQATTIPEQAPVPEPVAVDVHISTVEVALQETQRDPIIPMRATPPPAPAPERSSERQAERPMDGPTARAPHAATESAQAAPTPQAETAKWDSPTNDRFEKMRTLREEFRLGRGNQQRQIKDIERPPVKTTAPPEQQGGRRIKPLGSPLGSGQAETIPDPIRVEAEVEIPRPTPQPPTVPVVPPKVEPPKVELPPRQIDESLLRQLESDWRVAALEAHTGQRCVGCRFFQQLESGKGNCNCALAPSHRRTVDAQDLGCLNPLGSWWAPTDDGWLERTERRPRRATPLLDSLLREREAEEIVMAGNERQRSVR